MKKILIVEDDQMFREMLRQMLEHYDYIVLEASDGVEAIKKLHQCEIDLILLDIILPEKEGIETLMEVKKNFPDVKVISMSGGSPYLMANLNLRLSRRLGADKTLAKPFEHRELLDMIEELLAVTNSPET